MNSLRKQLRLSESCSKEELQETCNRYYALYQGILDSSAEASVKAIAQNKLSDLMEQAVLEDVLLADMDEFSFQKGTANINATVEQELAAVSGRLAESKVNELNKKIEALPHSAKRYYLSALVLMQRSNASADDYKAAYGKLKSACNEDPENPVYLEAMESIGQEAARYNEALAVWKQARKEELDRELAKSRWRQFWSGLGAVLAWIGQALLWVGGALLTVGGLAFSCMCSMFECCDIC